ncbi:ATP-binding cassette sub-family G member 2 [Heterocephalus glaber]|uniref:ATP-binding cassette sub-family G member 2 n=1 Tax=Heterocephalus glaber TaxID=10181 RepID=A0AAX6PBK1_HETGA|nr:ATP-binding cassette sub-family G member 2 [Heterocephalus glaber]XP_021116715.1 ATP-binding cassette sub-family G member 2 [Heterocephalus glaber]
MSSSDIQVSIPMSVRNTGLPRISSDLETCTEEPVLSFHNICYRVKVKSGFLPLQKTVEKEILSNVSGIMRPGLNAIMGPTGGGKSVLLNVLAGRKDRHGISGDVLINGAPPPADFKHKSGYVVQDDVVTITLTVRENLHFSAALRLPATMTNHEKNEQVNKVIEELGLDEEADSKVVSKRKRKRTSIGMELITDPPILFLDEPTTGLDSSTALTLLLLLKRISKQGRTIIFSIHRPQYSIFKLFDSLTLLASGKLVFHGPAQEAVQYFTSADYHCEPYNNPADFFLDVICGGSSVVVNREKEDYEAKETEEFYKRDKPVVEYLAELYVNSSFYREIKDKLDKLSGDQKKRSLVFKKTTYTTSFCHQLRWIMIRSFKNLLGYPRITIIQILAIFAIGVMTSFIFLGLNNNCTGIQNRASVLFTLTVFQCFSSVSAGRIFVLEEKLFLHEHMSGYYGLLPYYLGKLLSDLIPRRILPSIIFTMVLYFMFGLKQGAKAFFTMMLTVLLVTYTASSMALAITIGPSWDYMTTFVMNLYFVFMMIFLSMSLYFETIAPVFSWFRYLSIPHYGFMALQHNEFLGQDFCPGLNITERSDCPNYVICAGEEFLTIQGIDLSPLGLWVNLLGLASMMIFFLIITFLKLLVLKKHS